MTTLASLALAVAIVVAPAAQAPAPTLSGTEPLVQAGWMQVVDGETYVDGPSVAKVAETLRVYTAETPGYDRVGKFGAPWVTKVDKCDTRNRILKRDFASYKTLDDGCTVVLGVFDDPYTAKAINFQHDNYPTKKAGNSSTVQIDHIIPLKAAWSGGAKEWSQERRIQFANDPVNLWASDGPANGKKQDALFGQWKPANTAFWCEYVAKQVWVLDIYDVSVTQSDKDAFVAEANSCTLPGSTGAEPAATPSDAPTASPSADATTTDDGQVAQNESSHAWLYTLAVSAIIAVAAVSIRSLLRKLARTKKAAQKGRGTKS